MRLEIRIKDQETKAAFKEIAARFPTQEEALKELMKIYRLPGRSVSQKIPGGVN